MSSIYGDSIFESPDYSKLSKSHKTKSDKKFRFIDFKSSEIKKYLDKDEDLKNKFNLWTKLNKIGEMAICTNDDKCAGYVGVGTKDKSKGILHPLMVNSNYRGRGLSDILVDDAINRYGAYELGVYADNAIAIKLYESHGFVKVSEYYYKGELVYIMRLKNKVISR